MSDHQDITYPWAVLKLSDQIFAISVKHVETMVLLPKVVPVPNTPDFIRGVIDLRGKVFPLIDLRKRLGIPSIEEEAKAFVEKMEAAKTAHKNWLQELENSVRENRPFTLATDPHQCAFGKWYDSVTTDDLFLATLLKRIEAPHQQIHALALKVERLKETKDFEAIDELLANAKRTVFVEIMRHFDTVKTSFLTDRKEIAVAVHTQEKSFALAVDSVETVESFAEDKIEKFSDQLHSSTERPVPISIGKNQENKTVLLIEDIAALMDDSISMDLAAFQNAAKAGAARGTGD